jgi:hypothetical protein
MDSLPTAYLLAFTDVGWVFIVQNAIDIFQVEST